MKQATFLICAFLVLFQVCLTVCDDTDASTTADARTVTVRVSDLDASAGPLNDLSGRWNTDSANRVVDGESVDAPIPVNSHAASLLPCTSHPERHLLCSSGKPSGIRSNSRGAQLDNQRNPIVHTTPQLTK